MGSDDAPDRAWHECLFADGAFRRPSGGGTIGVRERRWLTVTPGSAHYPY